MKTTSKMRTTQKGARPQQHYLKKLLMTPHLTDTDPKLEMLSAVYTGNRI